MLSNRRQNVVYSTAAVVSVSAPLASVDICDIDTSGSDGDDDDKNDNHNNNNNGLAASPKPTAVNGQWPSIQKSSTEQHIQDQTETDVLLTSSSSPPPSMNGYRRPRPSTINLRPIASTTKVNDADTTDGCFNGISEDSEHSSCGQGINIQFYDIIYRARREISWDRSTKTILNGINGEFRAGELTALMGPSGAGKSTLLDILTGYTTKISSGTIKINGRCRDLRRFRRQVAYIIQDCELQMHITVWEAMYFSVNLKIGPQLKYDEKKERIQEILEAIGLYENRFTKTGELSGGQRKRLAIALELVDNPKFMVFDEPTSGLDSSTSTQVVLLLKQLAAEGRTIVCSIHQPSALLFGLFDHLYAMAEGQCIYAGATGMLVPFLAELELICPKTYNPCDYLLEISTHDYGPHNERLVAKMQNGLTEAYRINVNDPSNNYSLEIAEKMIADGLMTPVYAPDLAPLAPQSPMTPTTPGAAPKMPTATPTTMTKGKKPKIISLQLSDKKCCTSRNGTYATSFFCQWYLLFLRTMLCLRRDRSLALMRFSIHFCIALLVGTLYFNIGNDAAMMYNNFRYIVLSEMFLLFTSFCSMTILFPLEMPIVAREHFNRWYSKKAYYFALTFADLPLQFVCVLVYVLITYVMTAQPLEIFRLSLFFTISVMVTLISQGFGMIIGATCGVKLGVIVGPFAIAPFVVFSGFFLRLADAPIYLKWVFHTSFMKYGLEGSSHAIFGYNRPKLECNDIYCHYRIPTKFMKIVDMHHNDFMSAFTILLIMCIVLRIFAFFLMALRLKRR